MLEDILLFIVRTINGIYYFFTETLGLAFMDNPGTYLFILVMGIVMIPLFIKSVYKVYSNPNEYEHVSLSRKILKGAITIGAIIFFAYANFLRFVPPA